MNTGEAALLFLIVFILFWNFARFLLISVNKGFFFHTKSNSGYNFNFVYSSELFLEYFY